MNFELKEVIMAKKDFLESVGGMNSRKSKCHQSRKSVSPEIERFFVYLSLVFIYFAFGRSRYRGKCKISDSELISNLGNNYLQRSSNCSFAMIKGVALCITLPERSEFRGKKHPRNTTHPPSQPAAPAGMGEGSSPKPLRSLRSGSG